MEVNNIMAQLSSLFSLLNLRVERSRNGELRQPAKPIYGIHFYLENCTASHGTLLVSPSSHY